MSSPQRDEAGPKELRADDFFDYDKLYEADQIMADAYINNNFEYLQDEGDNSAGLTSRSNIHSSAETGTTSLELLNELSEIEIQARILEERRQEVVRKLQDPPQQPISPHEESTSTPVAPVLGPSANTSTYLETPNEISNMSSIVPEGIDTSPLDFNEDTAQSALLQEFTAPYVSDSVAIAVPNFNHTLIKTPVNKLNTIQAFPLDMHPSNHVPSTIPPSNRSGMAPDPNLLEGSAATWGISPEVSFNAMVIDSFGTGKSNQALSIAYQSIANATVIATPSISTEPWPNKSVPVLDSSSQQHSETQIVHGPQNSRSNASLSSTPSQKRLKVSKAPRGSTRLTPYETCHPWAVNAAMETKLHRTRTQAEAENRVAVTKAGGSCLLCIMDKKSCCGQRPCTRCKKFWDRRVNSSTSFRYPCSEIKTFDALNLSKYFGMAPDESPRPWKPLDRRVFALLEFNSVLEDYRCATLLEPDASVICYRSRLRNLVRWKKVYTFLYPDLVELLKDVESRLKYFSRPIWRVVLDTKPQSSSQMWVCIVDTAILVEDLTFSEDEPFLDKSIVEQLLTVLRHRLKLLCARFYDSPPLKIVNSAENLIAAELVAIIDRECLPQQYHALYIGTLDGGWFPPTPFRSDTEIFDLPECPSPLSPNEVDVPDILDADKCYCACVAYLVPDGLRIVLGLSIKYISTILHITRMNLGFSKVLASEIPTIVRQRLFYAKQIVDESIRQYFMMMDSIKEDLPAAGREDSSCQPDLNFAFTLALMYKTLRECAEAQITDFQGVNWDDAEQTFVFFIEKAMIALEEAQKKDYSMLVYWMYRFGIGT